MRTSRSLAFLGLVIYLKGVSPNRKSGVEPRRRSDVDLAILPAAPAAKLVSNVLLCIPFDCTSEAEAGRGILTSGKPRISSRPGLRSSVAQTTVFPRRNDADDCILEIAVWDTA